MGIVGSKSRSIEDVQRWHTAIRRLASFPLGVVRLGHLDTHFWIWWLTTRPPQALRKEGARCRRGSWGICLAAIILWEAYLLHSKQRLQLPSTVSRLVDTRDGIASLDGSAPRSRASDRGRWLARVISRRSRRSAHSGNGPYSRDAPGHPRSRDSTLPHRKIVVAVRRLVAPPSVRDVGVAGSNPVTPTIDSKSVFFLAEPRKNAFGHNFGAVWSQIRSQLNPERNPSSPDCLREERTADEFS